MRTSSSSTDPLLRLSPCGLGPAEARFAGRSYDQPAERFHRPNGLFSVPGKTAEPGPPANLRRRRGFVRLRLGRSRRDGFPPPTKGDRANEPPRRAWRPIVTARSSDAPRAATKGESPIRGGAGREEYGGVVSVKLHRCSTPWRAGPCWRVQKACHCGCRRDLAAAGRRRTRSFVACRPR